MDVMSSGRIATRVVISYPADLSDWGRSQIDTTHFRSYLRKTLDEVDRGDVREEFVGVGCCGNTLDIPLRIESVEGGSRVAMDTELEYVEREASGIKGGWQVQSEAGPTS